MSKPATIDQLDERDTAILAESVRALDTHVGPRVGDYVEFPDGRVERFSYRWPHGLQSSEGGHWFLSKWGHCDFSGGLNDIVPTSSLVDTGETRLGWVWFWHHDYRAADNGIDVQVPFRVYKSV